MALLTIALSKGKLAAATIRLLAQAGLPAEGLEEDGRRLLISYDGQGIRYLWCRPTDVPTYVEYGAADLGVAGKDSLLEAGAEVFELADLRFGFCRLVVAVPRQTWREMGGEKGFDLRNLHGRRVATKFPRVTEGYFRSLGLQVEIVRLHGNIELAPQVGLAEMIVDLVATGQTLAANDLVAVAEVATSTARLIANRASFHLKHQLLHRVVASLKENARGENVEDAPLDNGSR